MKHQGNQTIHYTQYLNDILVVTFVRLGSIRSIYRNRLIGRSISHAVKLYVMGANTDIIALHEKG